MKNQFVKITDIAGFNELTTGSQARPVVIFKHSLTCPISFDAYEQLADFEGEVAIIEVQRARELSREIAQRLGVAHESPQVLILRHGRVVWNASHFDITTAAVGDAVREAGGTAPPALAGSGIGQANPAE
jgi:monothiol bacilliredoxin